jgi:hypothetical protein
VDQRSIAPIKVDKTEVDEVDVNRRCALVVGVRKEIIQVEGG